MIYTSYFYQIRFMRPHHFAFSTALSDPAWFHNFESKYTTFIDKNGVINGLRVPLLVPGPQCSHLCGGPRKCQQHPDSCTFLKTYMKQLEKINLVDFLTAISDYIKKLCEEIKCTQKPQLIFLFHEPPEAICSERHIVRRWLCNNGIDTAEWTINN